MLTADSRISVGQEGREEIHPLVNSSILRSIFGYLDVKGLKSVRQTCSFWKEEANSLLQINSKVTINWHDVTDRRNVPTLPMFMKYVESVGPENVFYRNYVLQEWCLHSKELEMTGFWEKCGQHIRNLILRGLYFGFYEESYVRNVFYNWTPNMETLRVEKVRFMNVKNYEGLGSVKETKWQSMDGNDNEGHLEGQVENVNSDVMELTAMPKFDILESVRPNYNLHKFFLDPSQQFPSFPLQWKELFVAFPNLRTLSLRPVTQMTEDVTVDNIKELLEKYIEFQGENPDKLQNLKHLDVFTRLDVNGACVITDEHFEQAMKLNYKLEILRIVFEDIHQNLSYSMVSKYISKLSSSLKTLEIVSFEHPFTIFPPLRKGLTSFPNLTTLSINLNVPSSNNVGFLRNTPKLEYFMIAPGIMNDEQTGGVEPRLFFNTATLEPMPTLRRIYIGEDILTEDCVRKIGEWFPNLSDFGAIFDDKLLWAAYKFLSNSVEKLNINGKGLTDAGITGINRANANPDELVSKSDQESCVNVKDNEDKDLRLTSGISIGIGQMKKLRHLTISAIDISDIEFERLTDDSVYNGFILLTELKYLKLILGIGGSISEQAYRDLCNCRNILTLDTLNFYRGFGIRVTGTWRRQRYTKIEI